MVYISYETWVIFTTSYMARPTNVKFLLSQSKGKKLRVVFHLHGKQHTVNLGVVGYEHYYDKTGLLPKSLNDKDPTRRKAYFERHNKIVDRQGHKVINDPLSPSYWTARYLW
jgi:hypothetical protein